MIRRLSNRGAALCVLLSVPIVGCANRASTEILYRQEGAEIRTAKVAVLPVVVEDDGPSFFYYLALPLIWIARTVQFDFTTDSLEPESGAVVLRNLCYLALDQTTADAQPVPLPLVDRIVREHDPSLGEPALFDRLHQELGANVFLRIYLERWGSDYYILETRNEVRARIEIHTTELGHGAPFLRARVDGNDGAGITGGPTGFFDLAIAPLAGVDTGPILDLAAQVALGIGTLIGGLEESGELTDPPGVRDVETSLTKLDEDLHRLIIRARSTADARVSYRLDGITGYVTMRDTGEVSEDGLHLFEGQIVSERFGDLLGRRFRVRASTKTSRRSTTWYRLVASGPARPFDGPRVPEAEARDVTGSQEATESTPPTDGSPPEGGTTTESSGG